MKKVISVFLVMTLATTLFAGCGHTHEWQDATCTAPKTCTECKEAEGEALPHTWAEVTCAAPKTCTVCGKAEGEALNHIFTPANYQSAAICTVCGVSEGEPTPAVFAEKRLPLMDAETEYEYTTIAYDDHSIVQTNHVVVENYRIVASDDTHEAKDGYEWRIAELNFTLDDPSVAKYGYNISWTEIDYYTGLVHVDDFPDVSFNGVDYKAHSELEILKREKMPNRNWHVILEMAAQVPVGYDGVVLCIFSSAYGKSVTGVTMTTLNEYIAADPLFFRMA